MESLKRLMTQQETLLLRRRSVSDDHAFIHDKRRTDGLVLWPLLPLLLLCHWRLLSLAAGDEKMLLLMASVEPPVCLLPDGRLRGGTTSLGAGSSTYGFWRLENYQVLLVGRVWPSVSNWNKRLCRWHLDWCQICEYFLSSVGLRGFAVAELALPSFFNTLRTFCFMN